MTNTGEWIYGIAGRLFPICRSITGQGVRQTLQILAEYFPGMTIHQVPSGTQVFDWTVPREWEITEAYIEDEAGHRIIDFRENNLHVLGYSTPVDQWVDYEELCRHIYTQPDQPEVIPYVTSYYKERFGFCMSEKQKAALDPAGKYHMKIDSRLFDGNLTYGEILIPGETEREIFFSTYICHPSMANNECSGPALAIALARWIRSLKKRRYSYRLIFIPETIGSITYLSKNAEYLQQTMAAGFNLSCVGDDLAYSIVSSKYGDTLADRVLNNVLHFHAPYKVYSFLERGSDERQYNSAGIDLPVVTFCRSKFCEYPEYHTSADDMNFISPEGFQGSFEVMTKVITALEYNAYYRMTVRCEPQLGKRGLYPTISRKGSYDVVKTMTNFIAYADGRNDLIDISSRIGVPCEQLVDVIEKLKENGLLAEAEK